MDDLDPVKRLKRFSKSNLITKGTLSSDDEFKIDDA